VVQSTLISPTTPFATKTAFAQQQASTQIISDIRNLLNQTIFEYRNQHFTGAQNLASSAYLDHFELIEAPLEKHDKALKNETEIMLREQLRQSIKDKLPLLLLVSCFIWSSTMTLQLILFYIKSYTFIIESYEFEYYGIIHQTKYHCCC
jgi:hypothetical protein